MYILSIVYSLITKIRNWFYDKNLIKIEKVDNVNVICIGNIVVGGTGKTPCVQYYANKYASLGKKVAVISRGYKGKRTVDPLIISDGKKIFASVKESGDEPYTHAINLNIPVIVGVNRYRAILLAKKEFNIDTVILDDGFQHRKLYRDKNIVLIDALNPFGNNNLLPKGKLREGLYALNRANEFIITKSDNISDEKKDEIVKKLSTYNKKISFAIHKPLKLCSFFNNEIIDFNMIQGKNILIFTSIENPISLKNSINNYNPNKIIIYEKRDHSDFYNIDFVKIDKIIEKNNIDYVIITEKDHVKIKKIDKNIEKFYIFKIKFEIME